MTQHLPEQFVDAMCGSLQKKALRPVTMARHGASIEAGRVYVAPGHAHLTVGSRCGGYTCALDYGPARAACIPSGNIMLESAAASTGGRLLGVCLTGMGDDGADGMAAVRVAGGRVIAQDEASSVVWGMPGAVIGRGDADYVLPLSEIASGITQLISPPANAPPNSRASRARAA
ncbi:MAG: chemotaxis protein CheB [Nannocystaceae bacterium]|nr:chemotaxis protein CheB [Nannocystaceae bacterium]